jgi:hypothetical protein
MAEMKSAAEKNKTKYKLFANTTYFNEGGYNDFIESSDDIEELKRSIGTETAWAHIVNDKDEIILRYDRVHVGPGGERYADVFLKYMWTFTNKYIHE